MYILLNDSSTEPLTLSEVKTHLRIDGTDYDSILTPLIKTVRQLAEGITGRDFINKTWQLYLDQLYDGFVIQKSKLQSMKKRMMNLIIMQMQRIQKITRPMHSCAEFFDFITRSCYVLVPFVLIMVVRKTQA